MGGLVHAQGACSQPTQNTKKNKKITPKPPENEISNDVYCTGTLYTFGYTVSTNHKSRLRIPTGHRQRRSLERVEHHGAPGAQGLGLGFGV